MSYNYKVIPPTFIRISHLYDAIVSLMIWLWRGPVEPDRSGWMFEDRQRDSAFVERQTFYGSTTIVRVIYLSDQLSIMIA